ncbi:hypothetical protein NVP1104O_27 [Vibrio phage 1.104.O._10N.286.49.A12]|nr:hypothetical protein NVP1104O_27 [Vibrio phage 1.104.O._10N.286.49.A12]
MTRVKLVDISKTHYATRRFTMAGTEYQQNEKVDLSELDQRTAQRLIKYRYVTSIEPKKAAETVKAAPVVEPVKVVTEPVVDANTRTGKLEHVGGGQYEVQDEEGKNMLPSKVKGKDMARMAASQFGITVTE